MLSVLFGPSAGYHNGLAGLPLYIARDAVGWAARPVMLSS